MKNIIISEAQEKHLASILKEETYNEPVPQNPDMKKANKPYSINPDKVLIVKKYLDNGFKRGQIEQIGNNGMPEITNIAAMLSSNGEVLRNMLKDELQDLLIEKYKNMFLDKLERQLFMKQVVNDWFNNKIGTFGTLSVNHL